MISSARQPKYQTPNAPAGTSATITSSITPCTVRPAWMCGEDDARRKARSSMRNLLLSRIPLPRTHMRGARLQRLSERV